MEALQEAERKPPYVPFKTLMGVVTRMEKQGAIPNRIDRSYLTGMPTGTRSQLLAAFRSLGLTEQDGRPTALLRQMVERPEKRPELFAQLLRTLYVGPLSLGTNATHQQLEDSFKPYGLGAATQRKAIGFFLEAAKYAGFELSPLFKSPRPSAPRKARKAAKPTPEKKEAAPEAPSQNDLQAPEIMRDLMKKLPPEGAQWERDKAEYWLGIARMTFNMVYRWKDGKPLPVPAASKKRA